ncbi:hypothetical protein BCV69DRAFT_311728 [Microstroma glucosiphilum]|uniref:Uncharacterized protein n=1 Tax=Pseudomicrostroma glucosiphilum TaxID=1684307 RepID=A0A316UFX3_9BASI|nr:hypothetical protein BCV69DRAFT_311728 [Pseudomicrostroma glucosiphilum]PWN22035.1 hypothetical protein BCV69DRAFT_311728 [Pseudomicrostroma glucosiphilum]
MDRGSKPRWAGQFSLDFHLQDGKAARNRFSTRDPLSVLTNQAHLSSYRRCPGKLSLVQGTRTSKTLYQSAAMPTARAKSAAKRGTAAKVAPAEPASSSPANAGTRTSSRTRRAPLAFEELNTRTASSSSSTAKSSIGKPATSTSTTPTSRAAAKKVATVPPPPIAEDQENDPLPASRRRALPQRQQRQQRQPSVDSLAEFEASYIDDSRVSTAAIPADSSLIQTKDAPAHSTPIASPALAPAHAHSLAAKGKEGPQATKKSRFQSLLDEEMLSDAEGQLGPAKPSGSEDSEEAKTRRQLTENKLERVRSFVGNSGQHRGSASSLAPPPIEEYQEPSEGRRSKTTGTSEGDQEDEFGFYTVLKKSAANKAKQRREVLPGPSQERVHFDDERKPASAHEEQQDEISSLASFHPAQPASQVSSLIDQDSLQALLRSSPSDLARPSADKDEIVFSDDDASMDTDDYLYAPKVPRGDKKKPTKKPRRPNPRKGPKVPDAQEGSAAGVKGKGQGKSGGVSVAAVATSTGKTSSKKKQAEQVPPSEEEEEEEHGGSALSPSSTPEVTTTGKRSRKSAQNSKSVPVPITAAPAITAGTAGAGSTSAARPFATSKAGNVALAKTAKGKDQAQSKPKAKAVASKVASSSTSASASARSKIGGGQKMKARGAKRPQNEDEENQDNDDGDDQDAPLEIKGREKRLKMYDELDDYALGEEWVI